MRSLQAASSAAWSNSQEGKFITSDDDHEIPEDAEFIALCPETLFGWVKFNGEGEPPDRVMGLYGGFKMPARESLGDLDQKEWDLGLDGRPSDPWQHQMYLVLQNTRTLEMLTFVTSSKTGRWAVGILLRHYDWVRQNNPGRAAGRAIAHRRLSAPRPARRFCEHADVPCGRAPVWWWCRQTRRTHARSPQRRHTEIS